MIIINAPQTLKIARVRAEKAFLKDLEANTIPIARMNENMLKNTI